ncbi:QRFP-like peptide receptor [Glandiceps talaboti]
MPGSVVDAEIPVDEFDWYALWDAAEKLNTPPEGHASVGVLMMAMILIGNVWVIVAVFRQPKLRKSATNIFIVSLSVSDILIALFYIPVHIGHFGYNLLMDSKQLCHFLSHIHYSAMCGTTFSLICIGLDRFRAIVQPLKPKMTLTHAVIGVTAVWVCSLGYSSYKFFSNGIADSEYETTVEDGNDTLYDSYIISRCTIVNRELDIYFRLADIILLYIIPLMVLATLYSCMVFTLWCNKAPTNSSNRSKKRAVKMLSFVVVQFAITWLPYYAFQLVIAFTPLHKAPKVPFLFSDTPVTITIFLMLCNSWINPILYAYFNENYRKEFKKIFVCFYKCKKGTVSPEDTAISMQATSKSLATDTTKVSRISTTVA